MVEPQYPIHIHDDWVSAELPNVETVHALHDQLLENEKWTEVVGGLRSIAVQFDPAVLSPREAAELLSLQLALPPHEKASSTTTTEIPICYDPSFAPDIAWIAEKLGLTIANIADWHSALDLKVTMLGFMPGFAYLQCAEEVPEIGRLRHPRQTVAAGSIGLIGKQSCIYSFDSPGGWPIIGRTPVQLFDQNKDSPALLSAGQSIEFVPIGKSEFEALL